ncbi:CRTAC1 family protein [Sedimentitalea sp.]|uniref:CRTAC1 family protein n=1 Tax=Sedimentitalea sp. TaxID=2048915 RepID=UPI003297634E
MLRETSALLMALATLPASADPLFQAVDVPEHIYSGGWEHYVGGGLAVFDCNGDDLPELFAAGGSAPATLLINRSDPGGTIRFVSETPQYLLLKSVTGSYPLDIDSDGFTDLAVLRAGENLLMQGGPNCTFSPFQSIGFISADRWTTAFSATWEPGQSLPTLAFGNYVDRSDPDGPFRACDDTLLYRPEGATYAAPRALKPGHCPLSMLFSDWGRNGRADLRISNDRHYYVDDGQEQMWAMEDTPRLYDADEGWKEYKLWGMGIASRDLTGDGLPEVFLTSMGDQRLQLPVGKGRPEYTDAPYALGTTAHRPYLGGDGRPSTGWHVAFGDVQNNGRDDVFISKGNVEQMPDSAMEDPNNLLVQQSDGSFVEMGAEAGLASMHRGRGAAMVDLNRDGLLDVAVVNRRAPLEVWQNITRDPGNAIAISLRQSAPNVDAVGAWVEVRANGVTQTREITIGGGHAGGSNVAEHFGLGSATKAQLRVIWPDGAVSPWTDRSTTSYPTYTVTRPLSQE